LEFGIKSNRAKGMALWHAALSHGSVAAGESIFEEFRQHSYVPIDYRESQFLMDRLASTLPTSEELTEVRVAAQNGDAVAMSRMGFAHKVGGMFPSIPVPDAAGAVVWWKKAAELGRPEALRALGDAYYNGAGVDKDQIEGIRFWRLAACIGDETSLKNMANAYRNNLYVPDNADEKKALESEVKREKALEQSAIKNGWYSGIAK
jgi:TPR repeat protein